MAINTLNKISTNELTLKIASSAFFICSSTVNDTTKVLTLASGQTFDATQEGTTIHVFFENGNTASSFQLQINNTDYLVLFPNKNDMTFADSTVLSFTLVSGVGWVLNDDIAAFSGPEPMTNEEVTFAAMFGWNILE